MPDKTTKNPTKIGLNQRKVARLLLETPGYLDSYSAADIATMRAVVASVDAIEAATSGKKLNEIKWGPVALKHCPANIHALDNPVFLRRHDVEARTGLSRSSIYDRIAAGEFPKPVPLGGRSVGWLEAEITEWQKARIAERDKKEIPGVRRPVP
jgi:prophage regulatory protein